MRTKIKHLIWKYWSICQYPPCNDHMLECPICLDDARREF